MQALPTSFRRSEQFLYGRARNEGFSRVSRNASGIMRLGQRDVEGIPVGGQKEHALSVSPTVGRHSRSRSVPCLTPNRKADRSRCSLVVVQQSTKTLVPTHSTETLFRDGPSVMAFASGIKWFRHSSLIERTSRVPCGESQLAARYSESAPQALSQAPRTPPLIAARWGKP